MKRLLVLSFIGKDRPGLVSDISAVIKQNQGNWMESRLARLAGKFAGILQISIAGENITALEKALQNLSGENLAWLLEHAEDSNASDAQDTSHLTLELVGNDRPGIVHDVTQLLAAMGLNVEELTTEFSDAPMSSDKLFRATIEVSGPVSIKAGKVQETLETLANELMIEIQDGAQGAIRSKA
ncbi:MAG: hypothetical protein KDJ38_03690 [Gammaproteobacteria bacterium]|nr:hypothetical protein [Gammaproteobacteria bacterium]